MTIFMRSFYYYFSVDGENGGLHAIEIEFAPAEPDAEDPKAVMQEIRALMDRHTKLIDRVFAEVISGKREPTMMDTSATSAVGYKYKGDYPSQKWSLRKANTAELLSSIFGIDDPDLRGGNSNSSCSLSIKLTTKKVGDQLCSPYMKIEYSMGHCLNTCFFRFTQALENIVVPESVAHDMEKLDRTLASSWEQKGRDHYKALSGDDN